MKQSSLWNEPGANAPGYIEAWARDAGLLPVMGVDEAGRGCLAGPVVAAAAPTPVATTRTATRAATRTTAARTG